MGNCARFRFNHFATNNLIAVLGNCGSLGNTKIRLFLSICRKFIHLYIYYEHCSSWIHARLGAVENIMILGPRLSLVTRDLVEVSDSCHN